MSNTSHYTIPGAASIISNIDNENVNVYSKIVIGISSAGIGNKATVTGNQIVYDGQIVENMTVNNGSQTIAGGSAYNTTIKYGDQRISAGIASNTTLKYGNQYVQETRARDTIVNATIISNGTQYIYGGSITDTNIIKGYQLITGSRTEVSKITILNGSQMVLRGSVTSTIINVGSQYVSSGTVSNTSIGSGFQIIKNGNVTNNLIGFSGFGAQVISGGTVTSNLIVSGTQTLYGGNVENTSIIQGIQTVSGGVVTSTIINSGYQSIEGGSAFNNSIINGDQYIEKGIASNTNISSGHHFVFDGGTAYNTSIGSGFQTIEGGSVYSTSIGSGVQNISGGIVSNTIINIGSQIISVGNVYSTIINDGVQLVSSGAVAYDTSMYGYQDGNYLTSQFVYSGGIASNTIISGGYQSIYSGAVASDTTVTDGAIYADGGATVGNVTINNGGYLDVSIKTNIQGEVTLNQGGSAQLTTSNGGAINLVGDDNGGLTIIGDPSIVGNDPNTSVTTQIQGFSGVDASHSDGISLQYDGLKNSQLSNVTFPDNDHITITMDTGFSLTLNIIGIKQTGYSIQAPSDGELGLVLTVCFLSGTKIKTKLGVKNIEDLQVGDFVTTYDWAQKKYVEREVTWVGNKYCRVNTSLPDDMAGYPVRIVKDAIAKNVPYKDLLVTAEHCLFFEDKFIPARMLVNGSTIYYDYSITSYEYYHFETQDHAVIIADGVRTESYLDTGNRHAFNRDQKVIETSFQSAKNWALDAAAPLVVARDVVEPLYNKLNKRAQRLKVDYKGRHVQLVNDSDLHLVTDQGQVIRNKRVSGDWVTFMVPSTAKSVWVNSRRSRLCDVIGPFLDDRHFLGVLVGEIMVFADNKNEFLNVLREEKELEGWHTKQKQAGRWTKGRALLPIKSKHLVDNSVIYISLQILSEGPYVELVTESEDEMILVG